MCFWCFCKQYFLKQRFGLFIFQWIPTAQPSWVLWSCPASYLSFIMVLYMTDVHFWMMIWSWQSVRYRETFQSGVFAIKTAMMLVTYFHLIFKLLNMIAWSYCRISGNIYGRERGSDSCGAGDERWWKCLRWSTDFNKACSHCCTLPVCNFILYSFVWLFLKKYLYFQIQWHIYCRNRYDNDQKLQIRHLSPEPTEHWKHCNSCWLQCPDIRKWHCNCVPESSYPALSICEYGWTIEASGKLFEETGFNICGLGREEKPQQKSLPSISNGIWTSTNM